MSYKIFSRSILNRQCKIIIFRKYFAKPSSQLINKNACLLSTLTQNSFCSQYKNNVNFQYSNKKYSTKDVSKRSLPPLMSFPEITWPSLFKSIRNFILSTFIIKPYFDREFSLSEFVVASKQAVEVVSNKLAEGDIPTLEGLVDKDALTELHNSISKMSLAQRQEISINKNDIYLSFPYQVGIMFDESDSSQQKRFVEITMVYHVFRGLYAMRSRGEEPPINVGTMPEYQKHISICNYRFIREFTKGVEGDWTINLLNQFKPSDYIDNETNNNNSTNK